MVIMLISAFRKMMTRAIRGKSGVVYIEFAEKKLILSVLHEKKGEKVPFKVEIREEMALSELDIRLGKIMNMAGIGAMIDRWMVKNGLKKMGAIVCFPGLSKHSQDLQRYMLFQIALCVSRAPLRLDRIIDVSLLQSGVQPIDGQLDFLSRFKFYNSNNSAFWGGVTGGTLALLGLGCGTAYIKLQTQVSVALAQEASDASIIQSTNEKLQIVNGVKKNLALAEKRFKGMHDSRFLPPKTLDVFLGSVAQIIPANVWITALMYERPGQGRQGPRGEQKKVILGGKRQCRRDFKIDGYSLQVQEVTSFVRLLAEQIPQIGAVSLVSLKREAQDISSQKGKNKPERYSFSIVGTTV